MKIKTIKVIFSILLISTILFSAAACSQKNGEVTEPTVTSGNETTEPESTEAPTTVKPTDPRPFTAVQPGEIPVDSDAVYASRGEGNSWQKYIYTFGARNTGKQHVSFDVTPLENNIDASVDFADAEVEVRGFENLALMVRFSTGGVFGIQSGAAFETIVPYSYTANTIYHVDIYADMNAKKYDVYITAPGSDKIKVAEDYGFRNSSKAYTNDIGKMFVISAGKDELLRVENVMRETFKEYPTD